MNKPTVIVIIGSTKFKQEILGLTQRETLRGNIVINHGFFHHVDMFPITDEVKAMLDKNMLHKIDLADEVLVCDKNEYIGYSTQRGIDYARTQKKEVRFFSQEEQGRKAKESRP